MSRIRERSALTPGAGDPERQVVLEAIERLAPDWYGPGARLQPHPGFQRRPWSIHFHPTVVRGDQEIDLIVKIPLWQAASSLAEALAAGPQAATRVEYELLTGIEEMVAAAPAPGLTAVRAVAYVEEINAIVTERLDSQPLRELGRRRRIAAGRAIGDWLRRFHGELGSITKGPLDPADLAVGQVADGHSTRLPAALYDAVASIAEDTAALAGRPVHRAMTHGDLGPSNVLVTPDGRIAVIDPNLVPNPVEADPAKLAVAVRTSRTRLATGIPFGDEMHPLEREVLRGYGEVSFEVYRLCRRIAAVRRWIDVERSARGARRIALIPARRVLAAESAR